MKTLAAVVLPVAAALFLGFWLLQPDHMIDLVEALAWPGVIGVGLLVFRDQIGSVIERAQRLTFGGKYVSLQLTAIEADVSGDSSSSVPDRPHPDEEGTGVSLVLESWRSLEESAGRKVGELLPDGETFQRPHDRPIDYLEYQNILTPSENRTISGLRSVKNHIAHTAGIRISPTDASRYGDLVAQMKGRIDATTALPAVRLRVLTDLIREINCLIDLGKFDDIKITEVIEWIDGKTVFTSLAERTSGFSDLSLYTGTGTSYSKHIAFYHDQMKGFADVYGGDARRKWGVQNKGLCLLLAWTNEIIQQGSGWYPNEM